MTPKKRARKEVLPVNNLLALLVVLFTITSVVASYTTYQNAKQTVQELTGDVVTDGAQARLCVNKQPIINLSCDTAASVGTGYYCDVDASDPDNDTITFYDNTGLFVIDSSTGEIIFTPVAGDAGAHSITITVSDGKTCSNSNTSTSFTLTITGAPIIIPPGGGGGGGGGGAPAECSPQWECEPWSLCRQDGTRTRNCYTLNNCPVDRPEESSGCIYVLPPAPRKFQYPQFQFCDFDEENECLRNVGIREDWLMIYEGDVTILNFDIEADRLYVGMNDESAFSIALKRIKPVDVDGDGIEDVEFIYHNMADGRADVTGKLIRQVRSVRERPVYIQMLPWWLTAILVFIYNNACLILLLLMIIAALMIYTEIMDKVEEKEKAKKKK